MRHVINSSGLFIFLTAIVSLSAFSQTKPYRAALGVSIDDGEDIGFAGISFKKFVSGRSAIQCELQVGDGLIAAKAYYQYHGSITKNSALQWYLGGGPGIIFLTIDPVFLVSPASGLDFIIPGTRINTFADWRPMLAVVDRDAAFLGRRFGFGVRYAWK